MALNCLGELVAEVVIGGESVARGSGKHRAGGTAAVVASAGEKSEHGFVGEAVHEAGVLLVRALPLRLPERREAAQVVPGGAPTPILHELLQMRGIEVHQGLSLQPENSIDKC